MKKIYSLAFVILTFSLTIEAQFVTNGLHAHFKFENNTLDETIFANHLYSDSSNTVYSQFSSNDQALEINNNNVVSQIGSFNNSNFTQSAVSLWFRADMINNNQVDQIILQGASAGFGIGVKNVSGKIFAWFSHSSSNAIVSNLNYVNSTWHHLVAQNNGSVTELYIDGSLKKLQNENFSTGSGSTSGKKIFIGGSNLNVRHFTGGVNDVRIYNRTLTQLEIDTLSNPGTITFLKEINKTSHNIEVYPNPTTDQINYHIDQSFLNSSLSIKNITGQEVYQSRITKTGKNSISLDFTDGVYLMEITKPNGQKSISKIIKH